ncbi:hypothetical protein L3X38_025845 [Prunus dulcis]|uniref:Transposable element protein n=1 Tax=Prunus dulcis TaxID=3755 RepID=A0AAD4W387_PRUDU|nr:hypothetical protein L3X38_025845 [Prunus dulcis]
MSPKRSEEVEHMKQVPYASAVGSLINAMMCTRPDISYFDPDDRKSTSGFVLTLNGGAISWKSCKQDVTANSTTEAEYVTASITAKEVVWMRKFIAELGVVTTIKLPVPLYCDNTGAIAQAKGPRSHQRNKHIERRFHVIKEFITDEEVKILKLASMDNTSDLFTKAMSQAQDNQLDIDNPQKPSCTISAQAGG